MEMQNRQTVSFVGMPPPSALQSGRGLSPLAPCERARNAGFACATRDMNARTHVRGYQIAAGRRGHFDATSLAAATGLRVDYKPTEYKAFQPCRAV